MNRLIVQALLSLALVSPAMAQTTPQVRNLDVFVDLPTGFTFVKMPSGWKFVGKLEGEQLRHLPSTTLTSLLPPEQEEVMASMPSHPALAPAPRSVTKVALSY